MTRVLVVGESWSVTSTHTKGFDSFTTTEYSEGGGALLAALDSAGHDVTYMPSHVAATEFPGTLEGLEAHDVILFSDIGSNTLLLHPSTFSGGRRTPNRLDLVRDWVEQGGGFAMVGGYLSFQGIEAKANYRNTGVAEMLPVELELGDDRIETPQGVVPRLTEEGTIIPGLPGGPWPSLLGYQRFVPREDATVVAAFESDPFVVAGRYGNGRAIAYASDIGEHWAPQEFTDWTGFGQLWHAMVTWLASGGTDASITSSTQDPR